MEENASQEEYVGEVYFGEEGKGGFAKRMEAFLESRYFFAITIIMVAIIAFFFGVFWNTKTEKEPLKVYDRGVSNRVVSAEKETTSPQNTNGQVVEMRDSASAVLAPEANGEAVVASKNGTKYHYPWCAGAKQISEKNKIIFSSIEEARAKGYAPASNCKGLK